MHQATADVAFPPGGEVQFLIASCWSVVHLSVCLVPVTNRRTESSKKPITLPKIYYCWRGYYIPGRIRKKHLTDLCVEWDVKPLLTHSKM